MSRRQPADRCQESARDPIARDERIRRSVDLQNPLHDAPDGKRRDARANEVPGKLSGKRPPAFLQQPERKRAEQQRKGEGTDHETGIDPVAEALVNRAESRAAHGRQQICADRGAILSLV